MSNNFAQLGTYLWYLCRREKLFTSVWVISLAGLATLFAGLYPSLVPGQTEMLHLATSMSSPPMVAMMGNVYGMEQLSQASIMAQECLIWYLITAAIMNIFLVNRHTRVDEELGRLEMFRALPVGRLTGTLAIILFALGANALIGVLTGAFLLALNIGGTTVAGAFVFGFAIGAVGFVFAGLTLFGAQVFSTSRGVTGFAFALLALFYVMRALGDVGSNELSLISPLGLALKVETFYADKTMPLFILFLQGLMLSLVGLTICALRDHGGGIVAAKKGRARASRFLRSPLGLAWRLSRSATLAWGIGMLMLGASYGVVCGDIDDFAAGNEMLQQMLGGGGPQYILDNYVALIFAIMSMVTSVPVVFTALRIYTEEKRSRLEQVLAKAVPRLSLFASFIVVAFLESILLQALLACGLFGASGGELVLKEVLVIALSYLPAIWVMAGIVIALVGLFPRLSPLVWLVLAYSFIIMYFGRIMDLPALLQKATPFAGIPQMPIEEFTALPLLVLTLIAVVLMVVGLLRYRQRDIG